MFLIPVIGSLIAATTATVAASAAAPATAALTTALTSAAVGAPVAANRAKNRDADNPTNKKGDRTMLLLINNLIFRLLSATASAVPTVAIADAVRATAQPTVTVYDPLPTIGMTVAPVVPATLVQSALAVTAADTHEKN